MENRMSLNFDKQVSANADEMLTSSDAAAIMGVTTRWLTHDRHVARANGISPRVPFIALGPRSVRYKRADVLAYLDSNRVG